MRKELKNIGEINRHRFVGEFVRLGTKNSYMGIEQTVLLKNIKIAGENKIITDHLWFNFTKGFQKLDLKEGDIVEFDARVAMYEKGYKGHSFEKSLNCPISEDYKLSYPTKIIKIETNE